MAIDFSPLQQIDPGGAFLQGRERARAEQDRNMLRQQQAEQMAMQRQRQQTEFEQGQEDRRRRLQQEAQFEKMADLIRQNGLDPDDPKVLGQFSEAALLSRQPQLASFVTSMAERAAKRTAAKQEIERETAEMARIQGPAPAAAPTAKRVPLPAAPAAPTNMLAGTPFDIGTTQPAPAAPVNALVTPPAAAEPMAGGFTRSQINEMAGSGVKNVRERGERLLKLLPKEEATPSDVAAMKALGFPLTAAGYAQYRDAQRQDRLKSPEEEAQVIRIAKATQQPKEEKDDPRTVVAFRETDAAGNVTLLNKFGDVITPSAPVKGKPTATFEKTTAQRKQLGIDLDRAITELKDVSKKGGLIDQSTGSGAGRGVDIAAGFFGKATPGAIAIGKLAPIADMVLKMVPRFEGPQSDKDTRSYKEAAGQLADATLPTDTRKAAAIQIVRLMEARKGQFVTQEMATEGAGAGAAPASPNIDALLNKYK